MHVHISVSFCPCGVLGTLGVSDTWHLSSMSMTTYILLICIPGNYGGSSDSPLNFKESGWVGKFVAALLDAALASTAQNIWHKQGSSVTLTCYNEYSSEIDSC